MHNPQNLFSFEAVHMSGHNSPEMFWDVYKATAYFVVRYSMSV